MINWRALTTESPAQTMSLGRALAPLLRENDIILLSGPLGAGKTAFVRGLVDGFDPRAATLVTSQSYVMVGEYPTHPIVTHIDLYRLDSMEEVIALGYEELLYGEGRLAVIEWPELLRPLLEPDDPVLSLTLARGADPMFRAIRAESEHPRLLDALDQAIGEILSGPPDMG